MKLTNPETIQESEKEFIDTINAELDWEAIEKMLLEKHSFTLQEEIDYKDGDLIVYKDDIAYKFEFEIKVPLSVIFNREGDCLEISTVRDDFDDESGDDDEIRDEPENTDVTGEPDVTAEPDSARMEPQGDESSGTKSLDETGREPETRSSEDPPFPQNESKVAQMASNIADMISEINQP